VAAALLGGGGLGKVDFGFEEYDKPGAERSRRRRGEDDDLESDLEEDLLEADWLTVKKNPSEVSDEELNDDLLQSDEEDVNMSGQDISLNATYHLGAAFGQQDNLQEAEYTDDAVNLGAEGCEEGDVEAEGYQHVGEEEYTHEYSHGDNTEMPDDQMDYTGEPAEGDEGYQDEVLDIQINETLDGEFQEKEMLAGVFGQPELRGSKIRPDPCANVSYGPFTEFLLTSEKNPQVENEAMLEDETKEESDEEDEEDEGSGRIRFKSERKDGAVVRLADAGSNRRSIPETLGTNDLYW
uniref:RNA binding motif protein 33 n=1 Tax=Gasterosteus aculeatus TaxID=69293 RepID=G3NID9_GASAC